MLQAKGSTILLLFSLLEYAVHMASYKRSNFPHFSISSNINSRQNGAKMYPSCDAFISALMNSFVLYVKRSIECYVQGSGRCGQDGQDSSAVLYFTRTDFRGYHPPSEAVKDFCSNTDKCPTTSVNREF